MTRATLRFVWASLILMSGRASPVLAQTVVGAVRDKDTGQPVAAGRVSLLRSDSTAAAVATTDNAGVFRLQGSSGSYRLLVERIGYEPTLSSAFSIESDEVVSVQLQVSARAIPLDPLRIVARGPHERGQVGFARRRELGKGIFLNRDSIALREPRVLTEAFDGVPGIRVNNLLSDPNKSVQSMYGCLVIFVDQIGFPFAASGVRGIGGGVTGFGRGGSVWLAAGGLGLDAMLNADWVEGIEIYRSSAEVPRELRSGFRAGDLWPAGNPYPCGMAWIWTRAGW